MKFSDAARFTTITSTIYIDRSKVVAVSQCNRLPDAKADAKIHRCNIWLEGIDSPFYVCEDIDAVITKLA